VAWAVIPFGEGLVLADFNIGLLLLPSKTRFELYILAGFKCQVNGNLAVVDYGLPFTSKAKQSGNAGSMIPIPERCSTAVQVLQRVEDGHFPMHCQIF